jgi:VWFA-related protein
MRFLFITLVCGLLVAQQQQAPQKDQKPPDQKPPDQKVQEDPALRIVSTVRNIVVPAVVFDRDDNYVSGIQADQFRLFDNGKEQNIHVDESFVPISMVIAIQCNGEVDKILPQVNKIGNLIAPLLLGQQGEAAVLAFDSRLRTLQDFTSDPDKISTAVKKIQSGSMSAHLVDAVDEGIRMLKSRDKNRRRIIMLISESRDQGSMGKGRETLIDLQINNVIVYAVPMSRIVAKLSAPPPYPRADNNPPAMTTMPAGVVATPTTIMQSGMGEGNSASFMPLLLEIYKDAKAIFKSTPMEVFTKGTGGAEFSFYGGRGLEQAVQRMGEELHSDYTISYAPNNPEEGGFHKIAVEVTGHPEVRRVQTRPGYWIATSQ